MSESISPGTYPFFSYHKPNFSEALGKPLDSEAGGYTYPSGGAELLQRFVLFFWQISTIETTRAELPLQT